MSPAPDTALNFRRPSLPAVTFTLLYFPVYKHVDKSRLIQGKKEVA